MLKIQKPPLRVGFLFRAKLFNQKWLDSFARKRKCPVEKTGHFCALMRRR
jgi:hypothetical protein